MAGCRRVHGNDAKAALLGGQIDTLLTSHRAVLAGIKAALADFCATWHRCELRFPTFSPMPAGRTWRASAYITTAFAQETRGPLASCSAPSDLIRPRVLV